MSISSTLSLWSYIVGVIFGCDLVVLFVAERLWAYASRPWQVIVLDDLALSLLCALLLLPILRGWQRRARVAEQAMDLASDGFIVTDLQGRVQRVNQGFCTMTGISRSQIVGSHVGRLGLHDTSGLPSPQDEASFAGVTRSRSRLRRSDGYILPVQMTSASLADLSCFAHFIRDDTQREEADAEREAHTALMQGLLDAMAEGVMGFDPDGTCMFANRAAAQLIGCSNERALIGALLIDVLASGSPSAGATDSLLRREDGSVLPVQVAWHEIRHLGPGGGNVLTIIDISDRKRAERDLQVAARRLEATFDLAPVGMARIALDGRYAYVNEEFSRIVSTNRGQLLGRHWRMFAAALELPTLEQQFEALRDGTRDRFTCERGYQQSRGVELWVLEAVALVRDGQGLPEFFIVVCNDISQRKQAEKLMRAAEVVERSNAAKGEILSRISHELRTPLSAVLGFAQLLRTDRSSPLATEQVQRVMRIEEAGRHLLALIDDVLDLSRISAGTLVVSKEPVQLAKLIQTACALIKPMAEVADVALEVETDANSARATVLADGRRLLQVFINILSNAAKYNRRGGRVRISCQEKDQEWGVSFADTGRGMSETQLSHLYEPFNRLGMEREQIEGTGLGLSLSRQLLERMGARLSVESKLGQGTTFNVHLMRAGWQEPDEDPPLVLLTRPMGLGRLRVLYAEDNPVNVEVLRAVLARHPVIELRVATSGAEAIEQASRDPPDLLLLDMNLGDMGGLDVMRALREQPQTAHMRVVALSADALPEQVARARAAGIEGYLTKPFEFGDLLALIDEYCRAA